MLGRGGESGEEKAEVWEVRKRWMSAFEEGVRMADETRQEERAVGVQRIGRAQKNN